MTPALRDIQSEWGDSPCPQCTLSLIRNPCPAPRERPGCQAESGWALLCVRLWVGKGQVGEYTVERSEMEEKV